MPVTAETLRPGLAGWDGRFKDTPLAIWDAYSEQDGFVGALVALCAEPDCADAASWCLKRWSDAGRAVLEFDSVVAAASAAPGWACKLHVLQMLPKQSAPVPETALAALVEQACASDRPMVRAWGYTGADELAARFPAHAPNVAKRLEAARADETAGSVRARLKRCRL